MTSGPPPVPGRTPKKREARRAALGAPPRPRGPRFAAAVGGVLLTLLAAWFLISLFQPFNGQGGRAIRVSVPKGAGVGEIGDLLADRGVVASSFFFQARARLSGDAGDLKPGSYRLRRDMSYAAALDALVGGPPRDVVTVVIPEGRSRQEIARNLPPGLLGSYLEASRRSDALDPRGYGASRAPSLEGFLFPATYELRRRRSVTALVDEQLAAFKREFSTVRLGYARSKNLTAYDVLIIASMVEREAQLARERRLIAGVIYNRLRRGIPLGIDATIRYATGNWDRPLTRAELGLRSPYNTRTRMGLPPTPIGNPGLASIRAAAHPARTAFIYYVVKPCGRGEHSFSRTFEGFQHDSARYRRERRKRGGKSPVDC